MSEFQDNFDEEEIKPIPARPVIPLKKGFYVAGFVDGEGSFYASARRRTDYQTGWKFTASFSVGNKDKSTLDLCQECIGCGTIRESKEDFYVLETSNRRVLEQLVVPFFKDYPFETTKKIYEFELFQKLLSLLDKGIKTRLDLENYLSLRRELDKYRTSRSSNTDEIIRKTFRPIG